MITQMLDILGVATNGREFDAGLMKVGFQLEVSGNNSVEIVLIRLLLFLM